MALLGCAKLCSTRGGSTIHGSSLYSAFGGYRGRGATLLSRYNSSSLQLPPTVYGLFPTAAVLLARDPHRRIYDVWTLLDPTTGSSTLVPECRAASCNRGTAVDLLLRVQS